MSTLNPTLPTLPSPARPSRFKRFVEGLSVITRSKTALVGLALVLFWVIVAIFADDCVLRPACLAARIGGAEYKANPLLARYEWDKQFSGIGRKPPSAEHWLGTDQRNRDIWARLAHGARIVLMLAPTSVMYIIEKCYSVSKHFRSKLETFFEIKYYKKKGMSSPFTAVLCNIA